MLIVTDDGQVVEDSTGEVLDTQLVHKLKFDNLVFETNELNKEKRAFGSKETYRVIQINGEQHNCVNIKQDYTFGKVFRVALKELMESKVLGKNSKMIIATLEPYLAFPKNYVLVKSKVPTIKELEEMVELKRTALYESLKELEDNDVIHRVKIGKQIIIYFNPFLYCSGVAISNDTYEMFKYSKYNPNFVERPRQPLNIVRDSDSSIREGEQ